MSYRNNWRRRAEVGAVASRLLTIPVMALALLGTYIALSSIREEASLIADVSPAYLVSPEEGSAVPRTNAANSTQSSWPAPVVNDAALEEHLALDPSGTGRAPSP